MEFDVLKELAKTVSRNKIKNIEVLGNLTSKKGKTEIFFDALISDKFINEKDAVRYFYKSHNTKHASYIRLKNRLIHQIGNTSLFIDVNQPSFNDRSKAYFTAYKHFSIAVIIMTKNASKAAIYMFQLVLEHA